MLVGDWACVLVAVLPLLLCFPAATSACSHTPCFGPVDFQYLRNLTGSRVQRYPITKQKAERAIIHMIARLLSCPLTFLFVTVLRRPNLSGSEFVEPRFCPALSWTPLSQNCRPRGFLIAGASSPHQEAQIYSPRAKPTCVLRCQRAFPYAVPDLCDKSGGLSNEST